ncbi:MAG TPA: fructose-bisphosphate aldolase [Anaerolineae bacterium]|nr:fructose-bisphosphate aldolase [Anaerolineae bacterium]
MFKKRRMNRIFKPDGRSLIVAMDHVGFMNKPLPGLIRANETIRECVANGADAIMTTYGTATACVDEIGDAGLILTISSFERPAIDLAVEHALRLGADAIKVLVYPFQNQPEPSILNLTWLGAQCAAWGLPLLAETIPGGWAGGPEMRTPEMLAAGARIGAEAGADFIKTFATGDPAQFRIVADNCPVPVVILGGEKAGSDRDLLQGVKAQLDHGAAGVAMGRNLWGHPQPGRITAALVALIHHQAGVDEALEEMGAVAVR